MITFLKLTKAAEAFNCPLNKVWCKKPVVGRQASAKVVPYCRQVSAIESLWYLFRTGRRTRSEQPLLAPSAFKVRNSVAGKTLALACGAGDAATTAILPFSDFTKAVPPLAITDSVQRHVSGVAHERICTAAPPIVHSEPIQAPRAFPSPEHIIPDPLSDRH